MLTKIGASATELAFHALAANQITQAFHYALAAGDDALRAYALSDALKHYEQAYAIYEKANADASDLLHLYRNWGRALELAHRFDEAVSVYEELESLGQSFNNQMMMLVSLISRTILFATPTAVNDPPTGRILSEQAFNLAQQLGEHEIETRALWSLLLVHHYGFGEEEKAQAYGELALSIAREYDLHEMLPYILNDLNWVYCALGDLIPAHRCLEEAISHWRRQGKIPMLLDSLNGAGILYSLVGEFEQAEAAVKEGIELAHSVDNIWNQIALEANLLWVYRERGQYDRIITVT